LTTTLRRLGLTAVTLALWSVPARAQVTAAPESLRVVLPQGQETTVAVTLTNAGAAAVPFCLDFDRPLQRASGGTLGAGCGEPGELLAVFDDEDLGDAWLPFGITMTPDGRLFVAEYAGGVWETYELTADLQFIRRFPHPVVGELAPVPVTYGVTYDADGGMLWWTNAEDTQGELRRVMLLEGTLDGIATGRRIVLPLPPGPTPDATPGYPRGASYDPATDLFYYVDRRYYTVWAIDTTGAVPDGYPVTLARYPGAVIGNGVDAHGGAEGGPAGVRLEVPIGLGVANDYDRVTVTDPRGRDLDVDTPLPAGVPGAVWIGSAVRSRVDPNGVMYAPYWTFGVDGVAAFRSAPLAPSWLWLGSWSGEVPAGGSVEIPLAFRAGERAPGEYRSVLVVEDTTGVMLAQVPLTLVVEEGTPTEPEPEAVGLSLSVAPNPVTSVAGVTLSLVLPSPVRLAVYDVIGREVALLHEGLLSAGTHRFPWVPGALAPGLYLVRVEADGHAVSRRVVVAR
jgi:hypothetical protein